MDSRATFTVLHRLPHRRASVAVTLCLSLFLTNRARADDTVFLKNGGRVRGSVVEEDPQKGVRVKLQDGTLRTVTSGDVDHVQYGDAASPPVAASPPPAVIPAAPATPDFAAAYGLGNLHVEGSKPGFAYVDGAEVGPTPAEVPNLRPGKHRVKVKFAEGGSEEHVVLVTSGATARVVAQAPAVDATSADRAGFSAAAFVGYGSGGYKAGIGGRAGYTFSVPIYIGANFAYHFASDGVHMYYIEPEVGYDLAFSRSVPFLIRPYFGAGYATEASGVFSLSGVIMTPGALLLYQFVPNVFAGVDLRGLVFTKAFTEGGSAAAFSAFGTVGIKL
jgi:hypothetical protein